MSTTKEKSVSLIRIQSKGQVTLPSKLREQAGIDVGDYVEAVPKDGHIILIPQDVAPRHPAIDAVLAEALDDVRAGRVSPAFRNMKEMEKWFETKEGKRFSA